MLCAYLRQTSAVSDSDCSEEQNCNGLDLQMSLFY